MRKLKVSFLWLAALMVLPTLIYAQDAKQIDGAKKEGGKVIVYTSMETFTADAIKAAFEKKTGLQMEYWRGGSTEVMVFGNGHETWRDDLRSADQLRPRRLLIAASAASAAASTSAARVAPP